MIGKVLKRLNDWWEKGEPRPKVIYGADGYLSRDISKHKIPTQYKDWIFACSTVIAENTAMFSPRLARRFPSKEVPIQDHALLSLLQKPNEDMSGYELFGITSGSLNVFGESFWELGVRPFGGLEYIEPLYPHRLTPQKDGAKVVGWHYTSDGHRYIPSDNILHIRKPNPVDFYRGIGAVEAASGALIAEDLAVDFHLESLANRNILAGVLETDKPQTPAKIDAMQEQWNMRVEQLKNAARIIVLGNGLKYRSIQQSIKDIELIRGREYNEKQVKETLRVSGAILGNEAGSNRATAEAQRWIFIENTVKPQMELIKQAIIFRLLPFYERSLQFNFVDPSPKNVEQEVAELEKLTGIVYTQNEAREKRGLPPKPGGDDLYVPAGQISLKELASVRQRVNSQAS